MVVAAHESVAPHGIATAHNVVAAHGDAVVREPSAPTGSRWIVAAHSVAAAIGTAAR